SAGIAFEMSTVCALGASPLSVGPCIDFFFQAEAGIRDATVTGVQTCALPICADTSLFGDFETLATAMRRKDEKLDATDMQRFMEIGRASCRERVETSVGSVPLAKKGCLHCEEAVQISNH